MTRPKARHLLGNSPMHRVNTTRMMKWKLGRKTALLLLVFILAPYVRSGAGPARLTQARLVVGQFGFVLSGDTNKIYTIQTSTDLLHWKAIGNPQHPSEEPMLFTATN